MRGMDTATEHVHLHVVNYEPTYVALNHAISMYENDGGRGAAEARDYLIDAVERHALDAGLDYSDLDDVDYSAMIQWEVAHRD